MPRKNEFNILIAFLHISGLLIYLELKIKNSFLKNYQKTYDSTMLFGYIFINRIQPFEAANISAAFFLCRPLRKHNRCHTFKNKFQDDISCTLAMYSYIWDSLYKTGFCKKIKFLQICIFLLILKVEHKSSLSRDRVYIF